MPRVFGEASKSNVIRNGGLLAGSVLLATGLISSSASAEAPRPAHIQQPAVELMANTPVEGQIQPQSEFYDNGTALIYSMDSVKLGGSTDQLTAPPFLAYCLGHNLLTEVLAGGFTSDNARGAISVTPNAHECADRRLTPEDFDLRQ